MLTRPAVMFSKKMIDLLLPCIINPTGLKSRSVLNAVTDAVTGCGGRMSEACMDILGVSG